MKRYLLFVTLVALNFVVGCSKPTEITQTTVTLNGWAALIDSTDGTYHSQSVASGATFTFDGPITVSALTDNTGTVSIPNAPAGSYTVTVSKEGYGIQKIFAYEAVEHSAAAHAYLYPNVDFKAVITDIHIEDTITYHSSRFGLIIGPKGDTLDFGTTGPKVADTSLAYRIVVSGTFTKPDYILEKGGYRAYLLIATSKNISPLEPASWLKVISNETTADQVKVSGSTFSFSIYDQLKNILRSDFRKGDPVFVTAYICPSYYTTYGLSGNTSSYLTPGSNKQIFPCLAQPPVVKSFPYPWE